MPRTVSQAAVEWAPNRDPRMPSDALLDVMLERAFQQKDVVVTQDVRDYAIRHGWPVPIRERFKWARCLAVILCAVLATLLLGRLLESLRVAEQRPSASFAPTPTPEQPARPLESSHVATAPLPTPPAPRAQPVRPAVGDRAYLRMPDGSVVHATFRGYLINAGQLPLYGGRLGDTYYIGPHMWVLSIPAGINRVSWVDP